VFEVGLRSPLPENESSPARERDVSKAPLFALDEKHAGAHAAGRLADYLSVSSMFRTGSKPTTSMC
jgi:hypothetical protein